MAQASMAEITEALESLWTRWCYVDEALNAVGEKGHSDSDLAARIAALAVVAVYETDGLGNVELEELKLTVKAMLVRSPQLVKGTIAEADESLKHFQLKIALTKQGEIWLGRETDKAVFTPHCSLHAREDLDEAQAQVAGYNSGIVTAKDEEFTSALRPFMVPASVF